MQLPTLFSRRITNRPEMIGGEFGLPDAGNLFLANNFVVLTTGALVALASAAVLACGLVLDKGLAANTPAEMPYRPFGNNHFPVALQGQRFAVSVTDTSGHVGQANGAPQTSAVAKGTSYGIIKLSNGNHALNVSNTSQLFFTVVDIPSEWGGVKQDANTYNPVVIVEIVAACIQPVG